MEKRKVVDGLVSIIMPSWNTERFIAETIQSVIDQTYTNWELCLADGSEVLLPAIKECILEINIAEGYALVHVMEGLL